MPKTNKVTALRAEIAIARRDRGPRNRFDEDLRGRILAVVRERLAAGETEGAVTEALDLRRATLAGWLAKPVRDEGAPRMVRVVLEEPQASRSFVLELGAGRVVGLELDDVAELMRRLR